MLEGDRLLANLTRAFNPGAVLFREGERTLHMYILISGKLGVYRGDRHVAYIDKKGAYVGESCLAGEPHHSEVRVEVPSRLLCIPQEKVALFLRSSPDAAARLALDLAERLRLTTDHVVVLEHDLEEALAAVEGILDRLDHVYDALRDAPNDQLARVEALNALRALLRDFSGDGTLTSVNRP